MAGSTPPIVVALLLAGSPAAAQVLRGTVVDSASRQPVAGAQVIAVTVTEARAGQAVTGQEGQFLLHLRGAGDYRLRVTRLGYSPRITQPISVDSTFEASARLWLTPLAVPLDTVTVVAEHVLVEKRLGYLVDAGSYERQRKGFGYFLTRGDIEKHDPVIMSDVLRNMPGLRVECVSRLACRVTMRAARTMFYQKKCAPSIVLDGVLLSAGGSGSQGVAVDDVLNPFNIEALEVYPGPAGVPVQYGGYLSPCGAIIAWSRR